MLRNWNVLKMSSLLAAAFVAIAPPPAFGQTEVEKLGESVKDLKKTCETLSQKLDKLIENQTKGFDGVNADLNKIKEDVKKLNEDGNTTNLRLEAHLKRIKDLEADIAALKAELSKDKRNPALYPPVGLDDIKARLEKIELALLKLSESRKAEFSPLGKLGKILLTNKYPADVLFIVNGTKYRVAPGMTQELPDFPTGMFSYEVIVNEYGVVARNSPMLEAGKPYVITVRPAQ